MNILPKAEDFFVNVPLYKSFKINEIDVHDIIGIIFYKDTLDIYCSKCNNMSTFISLVPETVRYKNYRNAMSSTGSLSGTSVGISLYENIVNDRDYKVSFACSRDKNHIIDFYFKVYSDYIVKVGQFPSQYDLKKSEIKKYKKILPNNLIIEFDKAVGLASHGIGIGSFVYLRRIFEYLIEDEHKNAKYSCNWDEIKYSESKIHQKIEMLGEHLPRFLVENKIIYSILSKGIHELSEDECIDFFDPLKVCIELILDEKIQMIEKKKKIEDAQRSLGKIHEKIASK